MGNARRRGTRYRGQGLSTVELGGRRRRGSSANVERSLADETGGPIAQLLAIPQDGGDGGDDDPFARLLRTDIRNARGKALLGRDGSERGLGRGPDGSTSASDWKQSIGFGPHADRCTWWHSPETPLAACSCRVRGASSAMFDDSPTGRRKREALRQWHLERRCCRLARLLESGAFSDKLASPVRLSFRSLFNVDLAGRAQSFARSS